MSHAVLCIFDPNLLSDSLEQLTMHMRRIARNRTFGYWCALGEYSDQPAHFHWSESSLCAFWTAKDANFLHADNEDSDQTARMRRLIWVFVGRTFQISLRISTDQNLHCAHFDSQDCKFSSCGQWRLWSDCADAQADLSLRWAHISDQPAHFHWSESSLCAFWTAKDANFLHADNEDSDQTARMRRLIWVFVGRTFQISLRISTDQNLHCAHFDSQDCKFSSCGQWRLWSDCADAQADLSLRWAHLSEGTFSHVVVRIIPCFMQVLNVLSQIKIN